MEKTTTLTQFAELEKENRELQQQIGARDRQVLLELRAIALRHQNKAMREILDAIKGRRP